MPFLQNYARRRMFEIKLVEMRWGIRAEASAAHKTSEICMSELERCQRESQGFSYVFIGAQKYGFRPFPSKIPKAIYDKLHEACINAPKTLCMEVDGKFQSHRWLLDQHYQIDTNVYVSESSALASTQDQDALKDMELEWEGPPGANDANNVPTTRNVSFVLRPACLHADDLNHFCNGSSQES